MGAAQASRAQLLVEDLVGLPSGRQGVARQQGGDGLEGLRLLAGEGVVEVDVEVAVLGVGVGVEQIDAAAGQQQHPTRAILLFEQGGDRLFRVGFDGGPATFILAAGWGARGLHTELQRLFGLLAVAQAKGCFEHGEPEPAVPVEAQDSGE